MVNGFVAVVLTAQAAVAFQLSHVAKVSRSSVLRMQATAGGDKPVMNKYSRIITEPPSQGASQAMLYATGLTPETIANPQVGVCSVWFEGNPCNMHLLDLSTSVKEGVQGAGLTAYRFNTIGVSDGISMGTDGMSFSLQSRDIIADRYVRGCDRTQTDRTLLSHTQPTHTKTALKRSWVGSGTTR